MENPADTIYIAIQLSLGDEGRRNAMTRIWKVYGRGVYYYISRSLPGGQRDDCFQETMLKAYRGLEGFSAGRPLKPWLYRIAHNCCQDQMRRMGEESMDDDAAPPADDRGGPEEKFLRDELLRGIDGVIGKLGAEDSRIAYLRFFEEMKFRDIANIMNMKEKTVKTRMDAIKRTLRSGLREWL
jgi:RNA polymerase sigma factor (sigma-70 family)